MTTVKTKRTPPIIVAPDAERLMTGDMLKIRDIALEGAVKVSESMGVPIREVRIRTWESPEEDLEFISFNIIVRADDETVSAYWEGVVNEVAKSEPGMSEDMLNMLIYQVGISAECPPPHLLRGEGGIMTTIKTKRTPPVIVTPDAERLMTGDMLKIRDIALESAFKVSESMGVHIREVRIRTWESPEEDLEFVDFDIIVLADDETVSAYWEKVVDEVVKSEPGMSEEMRNMFIYQVGIGAERPPPHML